jgi:hypothetical protein
MAFGMRVFKFKFPDSDSQVFNFTQAGSDFELTGRLQP